MMMLINSNSPLSSPLSSTNSIQNQVALSSTSIQNYFNTPKKYSYQPCPICSERLLVRMHGTFVFKYISLHFSMYHHEWMHVIVNLHS
ncbi:hypothetical protein BCR42DRAFT_420284 [Absidia repens]|uniref:Uncharacterized protein n=1 Tax=Absidia repens TaxID=90262 RepID=A0A1X2I9F1_9FUNG|nr:hypothetical protein BCR42DRAFT_420284 [Absidia repens]